LPELSGEYNTSNDPDRSLVGVHRLERSRKVLWAKPTPTEVTKGTARWHNFAANCPERDPIARAYDAMK